MSETTVPVLCATTHELLALQAICADLIGLDHDDDLIHADDGGGYDNPSGRTWVVSEVARRTLASWADGPLRTSGWMDLVAFDLADSVDDDDKIDAAFDELAASVDGIAQLARNIAGGATHLYVI
jgi:hypothetical protein